MSITPNVKIMVKYNLKYNQKDRTIFTVDNFLVSFRVGNRKYRHRVGVHRPSTTGGKERERTVVRGRGGDKVGKAFI